MKTGKISLFKKAGIITLCTGSLGAAVALAGCSVSQGSVQTAAATTDTSTSADTKKEEKKVKLQVVDKDGKLKEYDEETNAEFLRGVLDEISENADFTYSGTDSEFGIMIDTVNGQRADYTQDGAYWAIYVNNEYGNFGADSQPVADGDTFELRYEAAK